MSYCGEDHCHGHAPLPLDPARLVTVSREACAVYVGLAGVSCICHATGLNLFLFRKRDPFCSRVALILNVLDFGGVYISVCIAEDFTAAKQGPHSVFSCHSTGVPLDNKSMLFKQVRYAPGIF